MRRERRQDYVGTRAKDGSCSVLVAGNGWHRELPLRLDLYPHSPTGFEWGYGGSGPAQLALAILADALRDDKRALSLYQSFKFKVVAGLPREGFKLSHDDVLAQVAEIEAEAKEKP